MFGHSFWNGFLPWFLFAGCRNSTFIGVQIQQQIGVLPFAGAYMNVAPLTFQFPHTGDFTCQRLQITGFAVIIPVFQFIIQQAGIPCIIFNVQIMNPAAFNGNV